MLPRIAITSLAAAALIVGTALMPNPAAAGAAGMHGAAGGWPPGWSPGQTWPNLPPSCDRVHVKYYVHKRAYWRWVERCQ